MIYGGGRFTAHHAAAPLPLLSLSRVNFGERKLTLRGSGRNEGSSLSCDAFYANLSGWCSQQADDEDCSAGGEQILSHAEEV